MSLFYASPLWFPGYATAQQALMMLRNQRPNVSLFFSTAIGWYKNGTNRRGSNNNNNIIIMSTRGGTRRRGGGGGGGGVATMTMTRRAHRSVPERLIDPVVVNNDENSDEDESSDWEEGGEEEEEFSSSESEEDDDGDDVDDGELDDDDEGEEEEPGVTTTESVVVVTSSSSSSRRNRRRNRRRSAKRPVRLADRMLAAVRGGLRGDYSRSYEHRGEDVSVVELSAEAEMQFEEERRARLRRQQRQREGRRIYEAETSRRPRRGERGAKCPLCMRYVRPPVKVTSWPEGSKVTCPVCYEEFEPSKQACIVACEGDMHPFCSACYSKSASVVLEAED